MGQILATTQKWGLVGEVSALRTLNKFAIELISIPSEEDLFWYVAQNVVGKLNFVDCVVYQTNSEGTHLRQVAAWGVKNPFGRSILNPLVIAFGTGITGSVADAKKSQIVSDLSNDQNYIQDAQTARSEICVPLIVDGRVVGVIDSEHPDANAFGEPELEILTTVASMTAAKLELLAEARVSNQRYKDLVQMHGKMAQEVDNRKSLEAKLFDARKAETVGHMAGRFAHEFNNLATAILGNLELLELEQLPSNCAPYLHGAKDAAEASADLVRNLLSVAQRSRLAKTRVELNEIIVDLISSQAYQLSTGIELDLAKDLLPISADKTAISDILVNLLKNASDAVNQGEIIRISTKNLQNFDLEHYHQMATLLATRFVQVTVEDRGRGIPRDRLSQIFDPFFTLHPLGKHRGLGLSIVRGLVIQSGGTITVESEVNQGSIFRVTLPVLEEVENSLQE